MKINYLEASTDSHLNKLLHVVGWMIMHFLRITFNCYRIWLCFLLRVCLIVCLFVTFKVFLKHDNDNVTINNKLYTVNGIQSKRYERKAKCRNPRKHILNDLHSTGRCNPVVNP